MGEGSSPAKSDKSLPGKKNFPADKSLSPAEPYRFHLFKEPESISPFEQRNSSAGYLISQLQTPLLRWQDGEFKPGLATRCRYTSDLEVRCDLKKNLRLSDNSKVTALDWTSHFVQILNPERKIRWASELFDLRGAEELYQGVKDGPALGFEAKGQQLIFTLKRKNREFLHRLTSPLIVPFKSNQLKKGPDAEFIGTGAYQLKSWIPGVKIIMQPNPYSQEGHKQRPPLEVYFVTEDSVALKLYQSKELHFLRRLPTAFIASVKGQPDYHEIDQVRFDYFGFTKKFREQPQNRDLQKAMALAFPYEEMRALYSAKPRPGCFGLPASWSNGAVCFDEAPDQARKLTDGKNLKPLPALFSQSVEDHRRALEWLQLKLDERAGIKLKLDGAETKTFLDRLEKRDASFFRRGVAPDRPTCAAVLENFLPGHPENYLDLDDPVINRTVAALMITDNAPEKAKLCREALLRIRDEFIMIPTGPIFFSILASTAYTGWHLNELNVLDLKDLHPVKAR